MRRSSVHFLLTLTLARCWKLRRKDNVMKIEIIATPQETADLIHLLEKETSYVAVSNCIRESLNELANSKESIVKI